MATAVNVISDPFNESIGRYKVGSHTGPYKKLEARYITLLYLLTNTTFPELRTHYFLETEKALDIETMMKLIYVDRRSTNIKGNRSEWLVMRLQDIMTAIIYLNDTDIQVDQRLKIYREQINYLDKDRNFDLSYDKIEKIAKERVDELINKLKEEKLNKKETWELDKWFFHE